MKTPTTSPQRPVERICGARAPRSERLCLRPQGHYLDYHRNQSRMWPCTWTERLARRWGRLVRWADGLKGRLFQKPAPWRSAMVHWGLSMLGSEVLFQLGTIANYGFGINCGTLAAWWIFLLYWKREDRQECDGLPFQTEDVMGPLANAILHSVLCLLWWYYRLIGG